MLKLQRCVENFEITPFSEWGQCYRGECQDHQSLGAFTYSRCCCGHGTHFMQETGEITCSTCPAPGTDEYDELCAMSDDASSLSDYVVSSNLKYNIDYGTCNTVEGEFDDVSQDECCCAGTVTPISWEGKSCPDQSTSGYLKMCKFGKGYDLNRNEIDECLIFGDEKLCPGGQCFDNGSSGYKCGCEEPGYYWDPRSQNCVDFDECVSRCKGGECTDTDGGYLCICPEGETEIDGMCQKSVSGMPYRALVQNKQETVDFNKPAKCFSDRGAVDIGCDAPFATEWGVTFNQCCCEGKGGYWGTESQCFACDNSIAKDLSCNSLDDENSTGSLSSSSSSNESDNTFNPDQFQPDYDDSNDNAFPSYDPSEDSQNEFDDSSLPGYSSMDDDVSSIMGNLPSTNSDSRAVPISNPAIEQTGSNNFCGLPGGCQHGSCVATQFGVTCKCDRGWTKHRTGACTVRQ